MRDLSIRLYLAILAGLILLPVSSPAPVFIKIGDLKGESADASRVDGWIDVLGIVDGGIELSSASTTGRRHKPLTITKRIDKATPQLMESLAKGTVIDDVILEALPSSPQSAEPYLRYNIRDCRVTALDFGNDPEHQTVTATFEYTFAQWHYQQLAIDGSVIERASAFYDLTSDKGGVSSQPPEISQIGEISIEAGKVFFAEFVITDPDTELGDITKDVQFNPLAILDAHIEPLDGTTLRLIVSTAPTFSGQTTLTVQANDGGNVSTMSFSVFVDREGTPWEGFLMAYFNEDEIDDLDIAGPIADPDEDKVANLLEFLLGTNPREHSVITDLGGAGPVDLTMSHLDGSSDDGHRLLLNFERRIDASRIRLSIYGSTDGLQWDRLEPSVGNPALYEESTQEAENPLFESVTGVVNPPDEGTGYLIRLVGEMR